MDGFVEIVETVRYFRGVVRGGEKGEEGEQGEEREERSVWCAIGNGPGGANFEVGEGGGKFRFWGGSIVEGIVVGCERWELLR